MEPAGISTLAFGYITQLNEHGLSLDRATHLINGPQGTYRVCGRTEEATAALDRLCREKELVGAIGVLVRGDRSVLLEASYIAPSPDFMQDWRQHLRAEHGRGEETVLGRAA